MRVVLQRVRKASVSVNKELKSEIHEGLVVLLGVCPNDSIDDINWLCKKICNLRIFSDPSGKMNHSLLDTSGDLLLVSQFTLFASTKKGNRPSYLNSASPEIAIPLYQEFIKCIELELQKTIATGVFGADMQVSLVNDGPVTIQLDSKNRI
jgi:D-tyrosyl-tRNA(Tyr) deacylase